MADDYYQILGIGKTADAAEIKKAYRTLAVKYHPDKTQGDKTLEEKFKKISEAYAVLSDPEKRTQYDTYGSADFQQRFTQEEIFRNFDIGDILREFGFSGGGGRGGGFSASFGQGGAPRFQRAGGGFAGGNPFSQGGGFGQQAPREPGRDIEYEIPLTLDELMHGTTKTITLSQNGETRAIEVKIPKGLIPGKKIRLTGKGEASASGGATGNLFITSRPVTSGDDTIEGNDVFRIHTVTLSQALLGDKLEIKTPTGKTMSLTLAPGTSHKSRLRLPGHGIPHMKGSGSGDLYVVIHVDMPRHLTPRQTELIRELQTTGL